MTSMMNIDCLMKKIASLLGIVAFCSASFIACNKVSENEIQESGKHFVKFTPVMGETRTVLEEDGNTISVKWTETDIDRFRVWENGIKGLAEAELNSEKTIATITGVFDNTSATSFVYSSCFSANVDDNGNPVVMASQQSGATSFDPEADLLIGEDITATTPQEELLVNFTRPVALTKMTLKGLEVGESVARVLITSKAGKLTGAYDRSQGTFDFTSGEASITVNPVDVTVDSDGTAPVYFVSAPVENEILEIEVWTSVSGNAADERHYKKEFAKGISFPANTLTRFTANVTCCEEVSGSEEAVEIFKETFAGSDTEEYNGGRDGVFSGQVAAKNIDDEVCDNAGWVFENGKAGRGCVKLGSSSVGSATTPALGITASSASLTFDAAIWDNKDDNTMLTLSIEGEGTITPETVTAAQKGQWYSFTATITGANAETKVKITGTPAKTRFFLDDIKVTEVRNTDPNTVTLTVADNTEISGSEMEATVSIASNKAWKVTSSDEHLAGAPIKIEGTAQTESFTVAFAERNASVTEPKVAHLTVVAGAGSYAVTKEITVTQKATTPYINISSDTKTQTVEASATSATFTVTGSNFDWDVISVTVDGETNASYTASKGEDGVVTVTFPTNKADGETTLDRVIVVTVGAEGIKTNTCTITQKGETYVDPNKRYYVEVTENLTDWTGNYLIVSGTNALPGQTIRSKTHNPIYVNPAGGMIEVTNDLKLNSVNITNGSESGKWFIHGLTGFYGDSGSSGGFQVADNGIDNVITYDKGFTIKSGSNYLRFNSGYFRYYSNSSQGGAVTLYKFNGATSELTLGSLTMGNIVVDAGDGVLTFSWEAVNYAQKYVVYWNGSSVPEDNGKLTSFRKEGLTNGEEYYIEVVAVGDGTFYTNSEKKMSAIGTPTTGSGVGDVEVLNEEFDNSSNSDSSTAITKDAFDNFSGETFKAYKSKYGGIKFGTNSSAGYITSKSLDLSKSFTVKINVQKYGSDTGKVQVTIGSVVKEITPTTEDTQYILNFDAATSSSTVIIGTSSKRAYIDNVIIIRHAQ